MFASIFCKYDLRKGVLFVLSWTKERQISIMGVSAVVYIVVRLVFMSCSVMLSGLVLMFVSGVTECGLFLESGNGFVYC